MKKTGKNRRLAAALVLCVLAGLCMAWTASAETKTAAHGGTIYLGRDDNGTPESKTYAGPAGIPANAVITKVRVEISGQRYSADTGDSATGTYLSVKVNNTAQTFAFGKGQATTIGKDYTATAGLAPSFGVQVTGYGALFQATPVLGFGGGIISQSSTGIFSLKVIVTYNAWYTVTWQSGDVILETDENLPSLTVPAFDGATPARAADARYTYHDFIGWEPAVVPVVQDAVYQAVFKKTVNEYALVWKNGDTVLETDEGVPYGTMPDYNGPVPQREATDEYFYTFTGWAPDITAVTGDAVYEAVFAREGQIRTISFDSAGGSPAAAITQAYATPVSAPADPSREGFTFKGWSPAVPASMPAGDMTCTAQWQANPYEITFNSAGGSAVASLRTDYDEAIVLPSSPTRTGYTFDGWTPEPPDRMPAGDLALTAMWLRNMYSIQYLPGTQGTFPIYFQYLYYNAAIPAPGFEISGNPGYTFDGWEPALPEKMPGSNTTHTAQWTAGGNLGSTPGTSGYTLSFDSAGGSSVPAITAAAGTPLTAPEPPVREGFVFTGWAPALPSTMPEADMTCTAQWKANIIYYPNNTLCAQGLRLRDIAPHITDNWQMFTPLDLTAAGEQRIPLIASNLYFVGEARVVVENGSAVVTYSVLPGVDVSSEFLAILPNLDEAVTTDPAGLQAYRHAFGQPIPIESGPDGDTHVVLYIMNVVDYNSTVPNLRLFTDRNPAYLEAVRSYQALMD